MFRLYYRSVAQMSRLSEPQLEACANIRVQAAFTVIRDIAQAENTIRGLLMTARANAMRASGVESGLLFYVDRNGTQRVVSIEQDEAGVLECIRACHQEAGADVCRNGCDAAWENVFRVTRERQLRLPKPMRAVPRYVVDTEQGAGADTEFFSAEELANNAFNPSDESIEADEAQRHRNYFTMVYSGNGRLLVRRDVLIRDDGRDDDEDGDTFGDLTGMLVGYDHSADEPNVRTYYSQDDNEPVPIDPTPGVSANEARAVPFLVFDERDKVAINFPSVDGLLVYDDSLFNDVDSDEDKKRDYLLSTAQPFYVSRLSGAVIRGPRGEAE